MIFEIKKDIKLEDVEAKHNQLDQWLSKEIVIDLLLPKTLENNYFGLVPALLQFGITWARSIYSGKLLLDIDDPETEDWDSLYENELVFPLVALVWNSHRICSQDGATELRSQLRPRNGTVFGKMFKAETLKGKKLLLTQFDHLPEDRGLLPCFEVGGRFIENDAVLRANLTPGLETVLDFSSELEKNFDAIRTEAIGIVYELMKNTFEWAREDQAGVALDPSLRGMLIRYFKKRRETLLDDFRKHKGLTDYFSDAVLKENSQHEIYFLEISVFDSGIGFVDRYRSLSRETEKLSNVHVVKKCLIKHNTTARGLGKDDKGRGLDRILSTLDRKGFLRIRTDDVCVYRNMISHPYQAIEKGNTDKMNLFDWSTNSDTEYRPHKKVAGALVTIVYPLSI